MAPKRQRQHGSSHSQEDDSINKRWLPTIHPDEIIIPTFRPAVYLSRRCRWARYALLYLFSFIKLMSIYRSEIMHEISVETGLEASPKPLSYLLICKRSLKIKSLIVLLCKIHCTFTLFKTEHIVWRNQENNVWPHLTYVRKKRKKKLIFEPMVGIKIESFIYKRNRNNLHRTTRTHGLMGLTHKLLCVRMMELCVRMMLQAYVY